jgi:hypothetical protein
MGANITDEAIEKAAGRFPNLETQGAMKMWPTPTSRDHKDGTNVENVSENGLLGRVVGPTKESGSLNPEFVEYLMGFDRGWTDLDHSATPSCRK